MADKKVEAKKGSGKKSWFSRVKQYWKDTAAELKKVVWPTGKSVCKNTLVVIAVLLVLCVMVTILDVVFGGIRDLIAQLV